MVGISKKGSIAKEAFIMLITIVFTSALVFGLVKAGVVEVSENEQKSLLNTEFIPYERAGTVLIHSFRFCDSLGSITGCKNAKNTFSIGEEVHFFFEVASSTYNGDVQLVENYRILGPVGQVLLEVDHTKDYYFSISSQNDVETVYLRDYFVLENGDPVGTYEIQLLIKNPLLGKEVTLRESIEVVR
jgi:hypothetical protein